MSVKEKAQDIQNMMMQGKLLEAFDKYYHPDVVMTEPSGTRKGKEACRKYEEKFLESVTKVHGLDLRNIASDEKKGTVLIESAMDVTFKDGNRTNMEQVAVQKWQDGQVIHERFYYDSPS